MVWLRKIVRRMKEYVRRKKAGGPKRKQKEEERKRPYAKFKGVELEIPKVEGFSEDVTIFLFNLPAWEKIPEKHLEFLDEDIKVILRHRKAYKEIEKIIEKMSEIMGGFKEVEKLLSKKSFSSAALRLFKYVREGGEEVRMRPFFNQAMKEIREKKKKERAEKVRESIDDFIRDFGYPSAETKKLFEELKEDYPKFFDNPGETKKTYKWKTMNDLEEELSTKGEISGDLKKTLETVFSRKDLSAEYKKAAAAMFKKFDVELKYRGLIKKLGQ